MASKKKQLVKKARALGVDSVGTISELEQRIATAQDTRAPKSEPQVPVGKPESEVEPEPKVETPAPAPKEKKIPQAHSVKSHDEVQTRIAKKSTVKFIGRWYTLRKGKPFIAPRAVVENLECAGLLETK